MRSTEGTAAGRSTRRNLLTGPILFGAAWAMAPSSSDALATAVSDPSMAGPLGDIWIGASDANVRLIEYAAVTCSHCAAFHDGILPAIRTRWIDSGRVRFALRGFPLNPLDTAAFMLARADGGRHYYAITDLLFAKQATWAFVPKPLNAMRDLLRQAGFDRAKFDAVLADQALYDHVNRVQARATEGLGVHATPTLFVNDARYEGALTGDGFDEVIAKLPG